MEELCEKINKLYSKLHDYENKINVDYVIWAVNKGNLNMGDIININDLIFYYDNEWDYNWDNEEQEEFNIHDEFDESIHDCTYPCTKDEALDIHETMSIYDNYFPFNKYNGSINQYRGEDICYEGDDLNNPVVIYKVTKNKKILKIYNYLGCLCIM